MRLGGTGFRIVRWVRPVAEEVGADVVEAIETTEIVSLISSDVLKALRQRAECEDGVRRKRFRRDDGW